MKKGFTLVELLAVIAVIGIIAFITVPTIIDSLNDSKTDSKEILEQRIIQAAKDWSLENIESLPQIEGETKEVLLLDIQNSGHLPSELRNPESNKYLSASNSYVIIKKENNDYQYSVVFIDE